MQTTNAKQTLDYYNANADQFIATTANVEFSELQKRFMSMLPEGGRVLDLGCGSGRDSLAFLRSGFLVDAMDGSETMVRAASKLTGLPVACALFDEYEPDGVYNGVWACSSLLHVPLHDLPAVINKYTACLKPDGVFYMSFKMGNFEGVRNSRWFTDLDEETLLSLIDAVNGIRVDSINVTSDVRPGRNDEKWLNAWCLRE